MGKAERAEGEKEGVNRFREIPSVEVAETGRPPPFFFARLSGVCILQDANVVVEGSCCLLEL